MLSTGIDSLEQRATIIELFDRHFESLPMHTPVAPPVRPLRKSSSPTEAEMCDPVARMRPRREVVMVRANRVCRRRLRH